MSAMAEDPRAAAGGPHEPDENVDERRLSRAVGAEQPEKGALGHRQRHPF